MGIIHNANSNNQCYEKFIDKDGKVGYKQYDEKYKMWVEIFYPMEDIEETKLAKRELDIAMESIYLSNYKKELAKGKS